MAKEKTTKERLAIVEVQLDNLSEDMTEIKTGIKGLENLHREQNGMLSKALGKVEKHTKDHEEDSHYWTIQQIIAKNPFKAILCSVTGALIIFSLLILSNEVVIGDLISFFKALL